MKRYLKTAGAIIAALVILLSSQPALAQEANTSSALSITPRKNYTVEPGKTVNDKLSIGNLNGDVPLYVTLRVIDFSFMDESGTPKLMLAENAPQTPWSLKPFIKMPETVEVPAGQSKQVDITISVPANQGAGSYYSAIQYSSSSSEGGNVNLSASGVTLAFMSIPGVVNEKMTLQKFGAFQRDATGGTGGKYLKVAMDESPSIIAFTLKNEGNVAESPAGTIILKDAFGNEVTTIAKANPNSSLALIGQSRRFEGCISPQQRKVDLQGTVSENITCGKTSLKPGRYTASLMAYYGQNGGQTHEILATATFWYLPLWFLIVVLAALLIITYIVWRIVRKLRGHSSSPRKEGKYRFGKRS
jgi:hypothetical protein